MLKGIKFILSNLCKCNNGMLEYWNNGQKKSITPVRFIG